MSVKNKKKDKVLSEKVKEVLRRDIELRKKIGEQIGVEQNTIYQYAIKPEREKAMTKYPIVIDILKKHTGFGTNEILVEK